MKHFKFDAIEFGAKGNELLNRSRSQLSNSLSEKVRLLSNRIPLTITPQDGVVEVVFAGQYSAGKSTILKALTGRDDIEIGGGITTQETRTYDWEGVKITDTPGIHTEIRPDHDEIAYRAIAIADLLVYVISNELFDTFFQQHFRKLAIDKDKGHEMMLVVNKMSRCAKGNSREVQSIKREDLRKMLVPFSPEDLRTSFIDAESAIESSSEVDQEVAPILHRKSGIDIFLKELNSFVHDKGLLGRYSTALYNLEQVLQEALAAESTGDKDVDSLEELYLQRRRALLETKERIQRAIESEIQRVGKQIRREGRNVSDLIHGSVDPKEVDSELQSAQNRVQSHTEQLKNAIQDIIAKQISGLKDRMLSIVESELGKELLTRLEHRIKKANISPQAILKLEKTGNIAKKLGEFLISKSFTLKTGFQGLFNLNHYSGTATHSAVKAVGKFFSHKFKPWEGVKWTRGIANAGRALAVVGTVITFVLQIKEDSDAAQLEIDLRESRSAIKAGFNEVAHQIEMHYDQATGSYIAENLISEIQNVDSDLAELCEMRQSRSDLFNNLFALLNETQSLIRELHSVSDSAISGI